MAVQRIKVLVTGSSGQLGLALQEEVKSRTDIDVFFTTKHDLDITSPASIITQLDKYKPDVIVNTAAYTAVDKAESNKEKAFLVNEKGVENIAKACKDRSIALIHISTDYVFDGLRTIPYIEKDPVNPQTVYGASKLAGERAIEKQELLHYFIIRTSWLYSKYGGNFYNTMLRLASDGKQISVVNDQYGSPTLANNLANALLTITNKFENAKSGIYHYSGEGSCTWYAFAKAILEKHYTGNYSVLPVTTAQYPTAARRPKYSVLDKTAIKKVFNLEIENWLTQV